MKKILSSLTILLLLAFILWGVANWYLGNKAELTFKSYLQQSSQLAGKKLFRAELLSYKKSLTGAKVKLQITSDFPLLAERMGEVQLNVKLLNGPVFIKKSGISIGSSRWFVRVNKNHLTEDFLESLFPKKLPIGVVRIDFENKAHYSASVGTSFADSIITGIYDLETENNRGAIKMKNFQLGNLPDSLSAKSIKLSYQHQKAITTNYKPGTASINTSSLQITHKKLASPLLVALKANSNITMKNNELNGFVKIKINNTEAADFPFETAKLSLLFNGFSADSFIAYTEASADLENLHQQAQWALEELGEVPEGQDQIWQLYDEIKQSSKQLPKSLLKLGKNSHIQLKILSKYLGEESQLNGNFKLDSFNSFNNNSNNKFDDLDSLGKNKPNFNSGLSLFEGEANVSLDKSLFRFLQKLLPLKNADFNLKLKNNKLLMMQ